MKSPDNNPNDDELGTLLRDSAQDPRRGEWLRDAARGLEARVLRRIAKPETWADAVFSLTSWRPLAAALAAVALIGIWTGHSVADVFSDDWLASQTGEDPVEAVPEDFDF